MDFSTEKLSSQGSELLSLMVLFLVVHEIIHHPEFQWEGSRLAHTEKPGKDEIEESRERPKTPSFLEAVLSSWSLFDTTVYKMKGFFFKMTGQIAKGSSKADKISLMFLFWMDEMSFKFSSERWVQFVEFLCYLMVSISFLWSLIFFDVLQCSLMCFNVLKCYLVCFDVL